MPIYMVRGPVALPTGWSPPDLGSALVFWIKATDGAYTDAGTTLATDGQTVQQWNDQSGNGDHLSQATSGTRPTYRATGLGGFPTLEFDADVRLDEMATATDAISFGTHDTLSAFAVCRMFTATQNNGRLANYVATGQTEPWNNIPSAQLFERSGTTNAIESYRNSGALASISVSLATTVRVGMIWDGVNVTSYLSNAQQNQVASSGNFGTAGTLHIGGSGAWWDGYVSEFIMTNTALDSDTRTNLDNYFKTKWGLS